VLRNLSSPLFAKQNFQDFQSSVAFQKKSGVFLTFRYKSKFFPFLPNMHTGAWLARTHDEMQWRESCIPECCVLISVNGPVRRKFVRTFRQEAPLPLGHLEMLLGGLGARLIV
jgi:hypothetical protein